MVDTTSCLSNTQHRLYAQKLYLTYSKRFYSDILHSNFVVLKFGLCQ